MAIADYFEWTIDFEGQKLADQLTHLILISFAAIGFVAGYALESLLVTVGVFAVGLFLAAVLVLPPWPMYNRNPQKWLASTKVK
ncbi:microsomal signal peptidase 12kDa subunit [Zychaea mexicana]|uniref:microsomal signal peptidase 12kDa subunit n=1 Tax=Zychaea mexicana TaxID=64656 RepID=UPI0022FF214F|nr:microsomal signal peptidase 12kDa subunit [Zychaea mexicana]KAI9496186.1 microsomal signal peptidase 12kDa subunit [Zychaea mexicana]